MTGTSTNNQPAGNRLVKTGLLLLWLLSIAGVLVLMIDLINSPDDAAGIGDPVAELVVDGPGVQHRPYLSIAWQDLKPGRYTLYDGDAISTDEQGEADIEFDTGADLDISPNTLLVVRARNADFEDRITIDLIQGHMQLAETNKAPKAKKTSITKSLTNMIGAFGDKSKSVQKDKMVVRTQTGEYQFENNANDQKKEKLGIYTDPEEEKDSITALSAPISFVGLGGSKLLTDKSVNVESYGKIKKKIAAKSPDLGLLGTKTALPKIAVAPVMKTPTPAAEPPPVPLGALSKGPPLPKIGKLSMPSLKPKTPDSAFKEAEKIEEKPKPVPTMDSLPTFGPRQPFRAWVVPSNGMVDFSFPLIIVPPKAKKGKHKWIPYLEIVHPEDSSRRMKIMGRDLYKKQYLRLPMVAVRTGLARRNGHQMVFHVYRGVTFEKGEPGIQSYTPEEFTISSLSDLPPRPIKINIRGLGYKPVNNSRLLIDRNVGQPTHSIYLTDGRWSASLAGYLAGSQGYQIDLSPSSQPEKGVHIVKAGNFMASIEGPKVGKRAVVQLCKLVACDLAYSGSKNELLPLPAVRLNKLNILERYLTDRSEIKVVSRRRVVRFRSKDIEEDPELLRAIAPTAIGALDVDTKVVYP